jgi:hypothetical protein
MKRATIVGSIFVISCIAVIIYFKIEKTEKWTIVGTDQSAGITSYIDMDTITKTGADSFKVLELIDLTPPRTGKYGTYASGIMEIEFKCENQVYRQISSIAYSGINGTGKDIGEEHTIYQWKGIWYSPLHISVHKIGCNKLRANPS